MGAKTGASKQCVCGVCVFGLHMTVPVHQIAEDLISPVTTIAISQRTSAPDVVHHALSSASQR